MIPEDLAFSLIQRARQRAGHQITEITEPEEHWALSSKAQALLAVPSLGSAIEQAAGLISIIDKEIDAWVSAHFS